MTMGAPGGPRFASATPSTSSMDTPTVESRTPRGAPPPPSPAKVLGHGSAISQLQPAQVRTLREAFQILDRDSDGVVGRDDVADMLSQLGMRGRFC